MVRTTALLVSLVLLNISKAEVEDAKLDDLTDEIQTYESAIFDN